MCGKGSEVGYLRIGGVAFSVRSVGDWGAGNSGHHLHSDRGLERSSAAAATGWQTAEGAGKEHSAPVIGCRPAGR